MKSPLNSRLLVILIIVAVLIFLAYRLLAPSTEPKLVIVYTSVDQPVAEPILKEFETVTGIDVQPVYDVEASKTTGLVNRLIAEKAAPVADVFWSSEFVQTLVLKQQGLLAPYHPPAPDAVAAAFRDAEGYWTGVAARARVIIINNNLVKDPDTITGLDALLDEKWEADKIGIANPLFGTTATQSAALYAVLGPQAAYEYFESLVKRGIRVVDGNSVVRDLVVDGTLAFGLTDTDDACGALEKGAPVSIKFPDQAEGALGTLVIPGTVALINAAPHAETAHLLLDYLVSSAVERRLLEVGFSHIPLHDGLSPRQGCVSTQNIRNMAVSYEQIFSQWDLAQGELRELFLR